MTYYYESVNYTQKYRTFMYMLFGIIYGLPGSFNL